MTDHAADHVTLVFGGSFDPPHRAHITLPPLAAEQVGAKRLLYVPANLNPLKQGTPPTPALHRLAMLRRALIHVPNAAISTIELDRPGPSYMVETLETLIASAAPGERFRLLIGADQALVFDRWKEWQRLLELAEPLVMDRPSSPPATPPESPPPVPMQRVVVPVMDISATEIRRRLAAGEPVGDLLPPEVEAYIREHGLYGAR